jgi:cytochrome d ubiquinol oxidase subunit II
VTFVEDVGLEVAALGVIGLGLTLYVLLGGADFGGGIWDLLASGPSRDRQRELISTAIAPVWEANHVWLIFVLVGILAAFPRVFGVLGIALYLPFTIALVGIVFRGAAFVFRSHAGGAHGWERAWTRVFGVASLVTPFMLGAAGASIATGRIRFRDGTVEAGVLSAWLGPLSIAAGALTLVMCAFLAATYLTVEADARGDDELEEVFRRRALVAGVAAGAAAAIGLVAVRADAPVVWKGMLDRAWPFVALSAFAGLGSLGAIARRRYGLARIAAALAVGAVLWSWGVAQWPHLVVPDVTAAQAAAPRGALRAVVIGFAIGGALLAPSLWLLFRVFKTSRTMPEP